MLNKKEILEVIKLSQKGLARRDIANKFKSSIPEITYTINVYNLLCKNKSLTDENLTKIDEKLKEEWDQLQEQKKYLLEKEAFIKLFAKNIIYKYKNKERSIKEKYNKKYNSFKIYIDDLKDTNFALEFDLRKVTKEKIDIEQEYNNYKIVKKINSVIAFSLGIIIAIGGLLLWMKM